MFRTRIAGLLVVLSVALSGCAAGGPGGSTSPSESAEELAPLEVAAAWLDGGSMVAVLAWGSSSCPPTWIVVADMPPLDVRPFEAPDSGAACSRDHVLRGSAVDVTVDPSEDLEVRVSRVPLDADPEEFEGDGLPAGTVTSVLELEGIAGLTPGGGASSGIPSAGWTTEDGIFALLTWGSSGCPPVVQDAVVSAPREITVSFAEPPADLVCTADMAARVNVVGVPDAEAGVAYELVLQGQAPTRVPIIGRN
jgi:hypothetical protein